MGANDMDIRRVRRLLRETARLAEHASLTGSLEKGSRLALRQYNAIREHLQDIGAIPEDLFPELDEDDSSFDELGVAAKLMEGYLEEDDEPEEPEHGRRGRRGRHVEVHLGGQRFDMQDLGEMIRSKMPEILWEQLSKTSHAAYSADTACPAHATNVVHAPEPPTPPSPGSAELAAKLQALADQLDRGELSDEQRAEMIAQITQLAREQSGLV